MLQQKLLLDDTRENSGKNILMFGEFKCLKFVTVWYNIYAKILLAELNIKRKRKWKGEDLFEVDCWLRENKRWQSDYSVLFFHRQ